MTTRRGPGGRASGRSLQVVGPDGVAPTDPAAPAAPTAAGTGRDEVAGAPGASGVPVPPDPDDLRPTPAPVDVGVHPADPFPDPPGEPGAGPDAPTREMAPPRTPRISVPARPVGARPLRTPPTRVRATATTERGPARRPAEGPDRERAYAERFIAEDEVLAAARARSVERGLVPVGTGAAAALTFLAATVRARSAVEIGTGLGAGTLSILRGMPGEGLLTSIDVEAEHQRLARLACVEAGFGPGRVRMISGRALDVLPRLSDGGYDLVVVDAVVTEYPLYLAEAVRLLRPGGVVALDNALWNGRGSDPARRDAVSAALHETARAVREDERLVPLMVPVSDGLLCAARR